MRIAVIGNGASAQGLGTLIDGCDLVVRTGQWTRVFGKGRAGKKMSAWAWPGYAKMNRFLPRGTGWQMWVTCPFEWHKGKHRLKNCRKLAQLKNLKLRVLDLKTYLAARNKIHPLKPPSTGFLAVVMAVGLAPEKLVLAGFDAGLTGKHLYADGRGFSRTLHPYAAEAAMLGKLERGEWLGKPSSIEVDWRKP